MPADILRRLVVIPAAHTGRVKQSEAQRVVVWLVGSVLAVVEHRNTILARGIGQIEPLMLRDLVFLGIIVAALDRPDLKVIARLRIGDGQWEAGFEASFLRLPVLQRSRSSLRRRCSDC